MAKEPIFLATKDTGLARGQKVNGNWQVKTCLAGTKLTCLALDPTQAGRVYAGTQSNGVLVSHDSGDNWTPAGLPDIAVRSLAVSQHRAGTIYAGCKPVSLYVSHNRGATWEELEALQRARKWWWFSPAEPPDWRPYVQALTISPTKPDVIMAGIEFGGVLRSEDGGKNWSKHCRGAYLDCHSLRFHPSNGEWIYQGGGGGAAVSQDGGFTWYKPKAGLDKKYGWMVAADPSRPEVWYFSASNMPNPLRGEFEPPAHLDGKANASIFRCVGGAAWEKLSGGLPDPLDYMAYALVTDPSEPGHLYAGLANGDVWHTKDYGESWVQFPLNLGDIHRDMILI